MKGNKRRKLDEAVRRQFEPQSRGRSAKDGKAPCQPITTPAFNDNGTPTTYIASLLDLLGV